MLTNSHPLYWGGSYILWEPAASTMALWWLNLFMMAALLLSFTVLFEVEAAGKAALTP